MYGQTRSNDNKDDDKKLDGYGMTYDEAGDKGLHEGIFKDGELMQGY